MTFRDSEKERYEALKEGLFSLEAQEPGTYKKKPYSFCLADGHSPENLYSSFRDEAIAYFRQRSINWHDGLPDGQGNGRGLPSNHLCCSQSACVNCLWPITRRPDVLASVFGPFLPDLAEVLPFAADEPFPDGSRPFMAFEWIGTENYLGEVGNRHRGANATSADFAFRFRRYDGRAQLVLGEWKYTEYYSRSRKGPSPKKTQLRVYRRAFRRWKSVQPRLPNYRSFFLEPFYQLMRLTLLAQQMERARLEGRGEMDADIVSVLAVVPKANREYHERFTSPDFARYGRTVPSAWANLAPPDRFLSIATETLLTAIDEVVPEALRPWSDYLITRYGWWRP